MEQQKKQEAVKKESLNIAESQDNDVSQSHLSASHKTEKKQLAKPQKALEQGKSGNESR